MGSRNTLSQEVIVLTGGDKNTDSQDLREALLGQPGTRDGGPSVSGPLCPHCCPVPHGNALWAFKQSESPGQGWKGEKKRHRTVTQ